MESRTIKILAIDDNKDNLISLKALIFDAFPEAVTLTAMNGKIGLDLAAAEDPDVILLDVIMPGMDGFEVCDELKADEKLSDIPVVFITALKGDKESRIRGLECGAEAFLAKPIDESELTAQIRAMVKIKTANMAKRDENIRLAMLVEEQTIKLKNEIESRKKTEEDLANTKIMLETAFEQSPVPMVLVSMPDAVLRIVNTAGRLILGVMDEPSPVGLRLTDFKPSYQDYDDEGNLTPLDKSPLALALQGHKTLNQERRIVTKEEITHWALVSGNPIYDTNGNLIAAFLIFPDVTNRKIAEEERTKLEAQLQQAQKMESVGRLAGGVAHDFNNMLSVIIGHASLAIMESDSHNPILANLEEIRKAAERSGDLTKQLLAFARKQTVAPQVLDLNETVSGMLKMLQRLIGENLHLVWEPSPNLWQVKMDPSQIDQILANLCVNAHDSITDVGKITIETDNSVIDEEYRANHAGFVIGEYVRLAVSDDGCGMDKVTLAQIFEPFFTTKGVGKGTGLGLATVYGIVKQNNGFINVYSEPGLGTTFTIYLPRYVGKAEKTCVEGTAKLPLRGQETILLVEDEPAILNITKIILTKQGYNVLDANSPNEALRLASEQTSEIHLLITDVVMPVMNGRDLAKKLQSLYPELKTLFMSGYTANVIAHHGVLDDGVYFIQKPFSLPNLAAKVRGVLDSE
jgi:signal transduction histidine kinase/response regulator RpfG family c-di-GMP phosphodiesterase